MKHCLDEGGLATPVVPIAAVKAKRRSSQWMASAYPGTGLIFSRRPVCVEHSAIFSKRMPYANVIAAECAKVM